ncbi:hypothetical protein EVAR_101820_1 [Eumeta japonica]|uniref:Gustatory receptor n=1 Tax=Eumeta variegata TaxID=151549 RepID=A0A4C1SMV7_EUMVA|nr:hypothetical protein EVAR_101820_1 [Eumeta japonica]
MHPAGNNAVSKYFKLPCYLQILMGLDSRFSLTSPEIFIKAYCLVASVIITVSTTYLLSFLAQCLRLGLLPCLPGIIAEGTSSEVDKIKLTLIHRLVDIQDSEETERHNIEQFLEYVEARPYRCRIWRVLNMDVTLPIGLLNLCTTYLIVIIQFTHLY